MEKVFWGLWAEVRGFSLFTHLFMAKIEQWIIDKVKDAADIKDVVGDFVKLRKAGVNWTGICPFHNDQNDGNFIVRPKTVSKHANTWHCFVCKEGGDCIKFLQKHCNMSFADAVRYLGKKYCIEVDNIPVNYTPPPPKSVPPPPPAMVMGRDLVLDTRKLATSHNLFCYWLSQLPWSDEQRKRLSSTMWLYCVGGWKDGRVVFWKIDHEGIPRSAKLMEYLPNGHRNKAKNPGWLYNQDGVRQKCEPDKHTVLKPLFGAHLLKKYPDAVVNIVESEKTALIMANFYGNLDKQLWLACGGLQWLNLESMQPLIDQGRTVWLWPDKDGRDKWQEVADKLGSDKVQVYTKFFDTCWQPSDGDKADAADITIRMMQTGDNARTIEPAKPTPPPTPKPESFWVDGEPFMDAEELADPRIHEMRLKMSRVHSSGWQNIPHSTIPNVKSVGEVIKEHPTLKPLLQ